MSKVFVILFFFTSQFLSAGNIDSLLKVLGGHKVDSAYVMLLTEIAGNYEDRGEYDKAILYGKRGKVIADSLHNKFGQQSALNTLGNSYLDKGEVKKALECHILVLKIREELGVKAGIAYSYMNLGNIYFRIGEDEKALDNYRQSINILYAIGDTLRAATCLSNTGSILSNQGKAKEAEAYYLKALAIKKRFKDVDGIAEIYSNLSIILMDAGKYDQALDYAFQTIPLYGESGSKLGKAIAYSNIGDMYEHKGDLNNAIKYQEIALNLALEMQTSFMLETCYQLLAVAYSKKNDFKNAVKYAELFSHLRDSVMSSENSKQIAEMQTRFETGKKEKQIELLQKDKSIRDLEMSKQESSINRQRIIIYTVIGGLLFVVALVVVILRSNRERRKINIGLERKNTEIEMQKNLIEEKNKMITDSIDYARNVQNAIIPPEKEIKEYFPESFISFQPKEIVSGDFYWMWAPSGSAKEGEKNSGRALFAVVDCVGEGVPGAFMSIMIHNMLENICMEQKINDPVKIIEEFNKAIKNRNKSKQSQIEYGAEISLIAYDPKKKELSLAGTKTKPMIVRDGKIMDADQKITLQNGDMIYLFTDGALQYTGFMEALPVLAAKSIEEQFEIYQKKTRLNEQKDDYLVVGIRI
jgi:tetratricopeptide (TPR) repeat protein